MTQIQRNEAISRKIAAYTAKATASPAAARAALRREGLTDRKAEKKQPTPA